MVGQYGFVFALLLLVLCGFFMSFLLSFRLTFVFHSPPAPSSFVVIIIRMETQSRVRVAVWRGPGGEQHYFHLTKSLSK